MLKRRPTSSPTGLTAADGAREAALRQSRHCTCTGFPGVINCSRLEDLALEVDAGRADESHDRRAGADDGARLHRLTWATRPAKARGPGRPRARPAGRCGPAPAPAWACARARVQLRLRSIHHVRRAARRGADDRAWLRASSACRTASVRSRILFPVAAGKHVPLHGRLELCLRRRVCVLLLIQPVRGDRSLSNEPPHAFELLADRLHVRPGAAHAAACALSGLAPASAFFCWARAEREAASARRTSAEVRDGPTRALAVACERADCAAWTPRLGGHRLCLRRLNLGHQR